MGTIVDFINKITESGNLLENAKDAFIILKKDYDFSSVILKTKEETTILLAGNENKPVKHSYKSNNFEITFVKNDEYCWSQKQYLRHYNRKSPFRRKSTKIKVIRGKTFN